ncbi:MAG: acyl carrier protein [Myxococcota bacterium]|nr:acyl carrier protein [Myxococcota bacterium]MEC9391421.1 acyl carrier protein [Myxococcota bacterium]
MSYHLNPDEATWLKVRDAFAAALGLEDDEVEMDGKLIEDLGAESLDFLDIVYRLERAFDIKIPRGGIEGTAQEEAGQYEVDGILTEAGLAALRQLMPEVPAAEFVDGMRVTEVPEVFRVATFYNLVCHLLEQKANGDGATG